MKGLAVVALCVVFVAVVWARPDEEHYEDFVKDVNIDEVLASDRLRKNYLRCFKTGEGCNPQAKKVKANIPDALTNACKKCTDDQKELVRKILRYTLKNHPDEYLELEKQYDPERKYRVTYAKELSDEHIVLPD